MNITKVHYNPAQQVTAKAKNALAAGQFVVIAGAMDGRNPVVDVAGANATPFGVIAHDVAAGDYAVVYRAGHILEATASASITAGAQLSTAASGKVATASDGPAVALALTDATANNPVTVALL
ncbi:hypothetical protein PBI_COLLEEN_8 [Corynebacterium phage Colleen]|uniref:DUF2190 family protein n=4 Tax=root TaxID=1 RepID=W5Y518_9CORY|nr:capsid cement protein [Corynebacterium vitaeruminis]YP_009626520.1 DUF2190 family protein [Corynebacterium phage Poushou]AWY06456.1 scaffolding protein [Corynebacterium phage TouchMeNot]QFG14757.1 hypothetical protein PBI_COLLEEN_8 [Corynebacterium phage Colleen]UVT31894.1 minor capsid protein [Corynebacterium phage Arianna]AHI21598.1 hypothetical protein B843_01010 [Corynebacterium vitaeruminis DSM 20294]ASJ78967.1 hypothetical protein PBI_POUSHOU_8 [Corynebacterium phage Poushou]